MKVVKPYSLPHWIVDSIILIGEPVAYFAGMVQAKDSQSIIGWILICVWLIVKKFKTMIPSETKD
jgi:hypothetical protein